MYLVRPRLPLVRINDTSPSRCSHPSMKTVSILTPYLLFRTLPRYETTASVFLPKRSTVRYTDDLVAQHPVQPVHGQTSHPHGRGNQHRRLRSDEIALGPFQSIKKNAQSCFLKNRLRKHLIACGDRHVPVWFGYPCMKSASPSNHLIILPVKQNLSET